MDRGERGGGFFLHIWCGTWAVKKGLDVKIGGIIGDSCDEMCVIPFILVFLWYFALFPTLLLSVKIHPFLHRPEYT